MSEREEQPGTARAAARADMANHIAQPAFWVAVAVGCLLFLVYPIRELFRLHATPARFIPALVGTVIFVGIYLGLMLRGPFGRALPASEVRGHVLLLVILVAAVIFLTVVYGVTWEWFVLYANLVAGLKLPARVTAVTIPVLTILTLGIAIAAHGWNATAPAVPTVVSVSTLMIGVSRILGTIRELRAARQEIARLAAAEAVTAERLRFARDLHDLLGHSLSTIAVKTALARRLLPAKPERAMQELDDVQSVTQDALREVREAVAGYRRPTLAVELRNAQEILAAAGIACTCEDTAGPLPPAVESVLAWAVREGVTNVVRHSHARHCTIRVTSEVGTVRAEVVDDGRGDSPHAALAGESSGNGLRGLAERAAQQGGSVEARPCATGGFRLAVVLPVRADADVTPDGVGQRETSA